VTPSSQNSLSPKRGESKKLRADIPHPVPPIDDLTAVASSGPRHPLAAPSTLDARLNLGRQREHFRASINRGPVCVFAVMVRAARAGDVGLALAAHEVLRGLGWHVVETDIPVREGRP
jgi:hypothetical protein